MTALCNAGFSPSANEIKNLLQVYVRVNNSENPVH